MQTRFAQAGAYRSEKENENDISSSYVPFASIFHFLGNFSDHIAQKIVASFSELRDLLLNNMSSVKNLLIVAIIAMICHEL
jgi:hypothetical protein